MNKLVYTPNYRSKHSFLESWKVMFRNIWESKFLIHQLFARDFFAAYKKSFLGFTWIFVTPLVNVFTWVLLQKSGMLDPGPTSVPYPAYVLVGTMAWDFFVGIFEAASRTLKSGSSLIMQVNYPHESLLIKELAHYFANFLIQFSVTITVLLFLGVLPRWEIIFFPLVALPTVFLASGIGLLVSLVSVITEDVHKIITFSFRFLVWTIPIIYVENSSNILKRINEMNPLTYLICSMRDLILLGKLYEPSVFYSMALISFVVFMVSWRIFYISEQKLVERMI